MKKIVWQDNGSYRNRRAEIDDYELHVVGAGKHEFNWAVFYKKSEIISGRYCRSVPEAQRICEAVYKVHDTILRGWK